MRGRLILLLSLPTFALCLIGGCIHQYGKEDCDTLRGRHARMCQEYRQRKADAEIRQETANLLKAYRECLQRHEDNPAKAKENCSIYTHALHEVDIKYQEVK